MERVRLRRHPPDWVKEKADKAEQRLKITRRVSLSTGNPHIDALIHKEERRPKTSKRDMRGKRSRVEDYKKYREAEEGTGDPLDLLDATVKGMGRPPLLKDDEPTRRLVSGLASIQCTKHEAAAVFGVSWHTFHKFLSKNQTIKEIWDNGLPAGRASLRRKQFAMADRSAPMAIWLGKQYLEQRDKVDVAGPNGGPLQSVSIDAAQLAKLTPIQRKSLQQALEILRPEMFEGIVTDAVEVKAIEYDPDS